MQDDDARLMGLAESVSDGAAVDWGAQGRDAQDGPTRELVRHLQTIAGIAAASRLQQSLERSCGETLEETAATEPGPGRETGTLRKWGDLEILDKIGEGAYGEVFRARDPRLDREVALKLLRPTTSGELEIASRTIQEGSLLARFRHPNLITVHGAERHDGRVGLWMELIHGRTLAELLDEQGPLGAREAAIIGLDLCRALAAVHGEGLVHRDVKAQNVMRETGGRILLMDLGATLDRRAGDAGGDRSITGTPFYMAPEVFEGEPATPRSDIYSLGVLLYHLVTHAYPVTAGSLPELRAAHAAGRITRLRDRRPDLPDAFVHVVERALARRAEDRFSTAGDFEAALAATLGSAGMYQSGSREPRGSGKPNRARGVWGVAAAAAVVVGAVWLATILKRPSSGEPRVGAGADLRADQHTSFPPEKIEVPVGSQREPSAPVTKPATSGLVGEGDVTRSPRVEQTRGGDAPPVHVLPLPAVPVQEPSSSFADAVVEATLYRDVQGTAPDEPLVSGARVRTNDGIYLEIESRGAMHVYVVNQPKVGPSFVLFPLAGAELRNPLEGGVRHRLPGVVEGAYRNWGVSSAGGTESFLVIAAERPLEELESTLTRIQQATSETPGLETERLRGMGRLVQGEPPPSGSDNELLAETLKRLSGRGIWMRKIVLENPGD